MKIQQPTELAPQHVASLRRRLRRELEMRRDALLQMTQGSVPRWNQQHDIVDLLGKLSTTRPV